MKKDIQKILMFVLMAISFLILGALYLWAPVCEGLLELANGTMVHMKCFYTSQATTVLVFLLLVLAITSLLTQRTDGIMIIALGIMLIVSTYQSFLGIGICAKETMDCHNTALWIRSGGVLTILIGFVLFLKNQMKVTKG